MTSCHTGVRVSSFSAKESELCYALTLHSLHSSTIGVQDLRIALLHHLLNRDCFESQCLSLNYVTIDQTACLCITEGFLSSLAIAEHIFKLLYNVASITVSVDSLMLVVISVGC